MEPDNLAERVTVLETGMRALAGRVRASEQDAAAARVLAGAADRDVSEFRDEVRDFRRAAVSSLSALREDMNDGFRRVDEKFVHVDNGFVELRGKLHAAAAGQQHIVELIQGLTGNQGAGGSAGRAED